MNYIGTMNRLQRALLQHNLVVTIGRSEFFSVDQGRFIPMYSLTTPILTYSNRQKRWVNGKLEIIKTCSQIDALMCMVDIYKAVSTGTEQEQI